VGKPVKGNVLPTSFSLGETDEESGDRHEGVRSNG
jgi:hypothetical protein